MCFISAKLRLPLRVQNIFNSSDVHLAEVTERAIVQNASRPPLRLHTGIRHCKRKRVVLTMQALVTIVASQCLLHCGGQRMYPQPQMLRSFTYIIDYRYVT